MYSDRMCKTKASSTQGSFCKPINLIFCGGNAAFFIFSLPGAAEIRHAQSSAALFWERLYSSAVISILETAYSVCPLHRIVDMESLFRGDDALAGAGDIVTFEQCGDDGGSCGGRADAQDRKSGV